LVIRVGGEHLGLLGWDGCVSWDQGCHHTTSSFETKRQWSDVKQ